MSDVRRTEVTVGYPGAAESLLLAASPQLRNMATIGGNLMQRTRCPYFAPLPRRLATSASPVLAARRGTADSSGQAIFGVTTDRRGHPSIGFAVALVALDAIVDVGAPAAGVRPVPMAGL